MSVSKPEVDDIKFSLVYENEKGKIETYSSSGPNKLKAIIKCNVSNAKSISKNNLVMVDITPVCEDNVCIHTPTIEEL